MIPDAAVEALARVLAGQALFDADCGGYGWDAETDSSDHFMPTARKKARRYLEAAGPHLASVGDEAFGYAVSAIRGHAEMTTAEAEAAVRDILNALGRA